MNDHTIIFTDGSSSGNPGPGGWAALLVLPTNLVQELGGREEHTTNNRMELQAVINALTFLGNKECDVTIHTDSSYVIQGITKWVKGWVKNNWITSTKTDVVNRDLWERLIELIEIREELGKITWKHIAGHAGIPGNERADEIATSFTNNKEPELFKGPYDVYGIDLKSVVPNRVKKEVKDTKRSRSKEKHFHMSAKLMEKFLRTKHGLNVKSG